MRAGVRHRYEWRGTGQTLGTVRIDDGESLVSKAINAARIGLCGDGSRKLSLDTAVETMLRDWNPTGRSRTGDLGGRLDRHVIEC